MKIKIIAAIGKNNELGKNGDLPAWKLATDMKRFKDLTAGGVVVMGRKTFESFGRYNKDGIAKPLTHRTNVVITRDKDWQHNGVQTFSSIDEVLQAFRNENSLWIIGGGEIYRQFLELADELHLTHVDIETEADTFFPEFNRNNYKIDCGDEMVADEKNSHASKYILYTRKH